MGVVEALLCDVALKRMKRALVAWQDRKGGSVHVLFSCVKVRVR